MARRKRSSKVLEKADRRIASLRSINPDLNLGNGLTVDVYTTLITDMRDRLAAYNTVLSTVDKTYNDMLLIEQKLGDYSELLLLGVATKFGKSSDEYEMAGGVKKSDRKRSTRKVSDAPIAVAS
ncbi:MAG: hypothetical protein LH702_31115 [Phormidesmis sp. CAN_BIN44]|nr:hypothetical protein [Phormidesmis sp. CAN_BIN44]